MVKVSKSFILLEKTFLGHFYRHLATFYWSHCSRGTRSRDLYYKCCLIFSISLFNPKRDARATANESMKPDMGTWIAEWYHTWLWTSVCSATPWAVSSSFSDIKLFIRPMHNIYTFYNSIWFDTIVCLPNSIKYLPM